MACRSGCLPPWGLQGGWFLCFFQFPGITVLDSWPRLHFQSQHGFLFSFPLLWQPLPQNIARNGFFTIKVSDDEDGSTWTVKVILSSVVLTFTVPANSFCHLRRHPCGGMFWESRLFVPLLCAAAFLLTCSRSLHLAEVLGDQAAARWDQHSQPGLPWPQADSAEEVAIVVVTAKVCASWNGG